MSGNSCPRVALAVLIREQEGPKTPRTEMDRRVLDRLLDLADAADQAARQARATG